SEKQFEHQQLIALLVADLPPLQKSILLLRDLEGYAYQEIGELLSLTEAQVKVYLFRARLKVKKRIKGQFVLAS
ncbi:MAG: RNA polymerase sigma factor, partial [Sphingomonadales bacterium]